MSRIPHLLAPYLALPSEASLILLTSVLGGSTNWLLLRFLHSTLIPSPDAPDEGENAKVVLVSFLRDANFWREGGKKVVCVFEIFSGFPPVRWEFIGEIHVYFVQLGNSTFHV